MIWMSASTLAGGDRESYNLPAAAVALRPVGAAAPAPLYAAPSVGGMGYHEASSRASQPVGWGRLAVGARCLVGGVRQPRSGDGATAGHDVPLRQRMRAALKLLFGPAKTAGG